MIFFSFFISMNVALWSYTFTGVGYDLIKTILNTATSAKATWENWENVHSYWQQGHYIHPLHVQVPFFLKIKAPIIKGKWAIRDMVFIKALRIRGFGFANALIDSLQRKHLLLYLLYSPAWAVIRAVWRLNAPLRGAKLELPPPQGRGLASGLRVEATVAGLNICPCIGVLDTACVCARWTPGCQPKETWSGTDHRWGGPDPL